MFLANWLVFLILACRCCILLKRYCTVKLALLKHQQSVLLLYLYALQGVHSINYLQEYDSRVLSKVLVYWGDRLRGHDEIPRHAYKHNEEAMTPGLKYTYKICIDQGMKKKFPSCDRTKIMLKFPARLER